MVVLFGPRGHVDGRTAPGVNLTYPAHVKENIEGAVDSGKTDAGIQSMGPLIYLGGAEVVMAADNDIQHNLALWSQLISAGLEGSQDVLLCWYHIGA